MLPDILKGIKLDEVQKLCYEQLKAMEITAIKQTIESPGDNTTSSKVNDISSNEDDTKVTSCEHQTSHDSSKKESTELLAVAAEVDVVLSESPPVISEGGNSLCDGNLLNDKQSTVDCSNSNKNDIPTATESSSVMECSGVNEDSIELLATVGDDIDRELTLCPPLSSSSQDDSSKQTAPVMTNPISSAVTNDNINDMAVLNELHMRKRALQSQLKKQQLDKKLNEQRTKEELLLRQKALQSLLAATASKKTNKNNVVAS